MHEQDTYRGRVCECPVVNGVQYDGDGYTHCKGTFPSFSCHAMARYREILEAACLCLFPCRRSRRAGQVRAEPRRVLVGDPGGTHLLRLLGMPLFSSLSHSFSPHNPIVHHPMSVLTHELCQDNALTGCRCPPGFQGDGHKCEG